MRYRLPPGHAAGDALLFHTDCGFVEIMSDLFEHGHRIGTVFRMLTDVDETLKEFIGVGEVEVSGNHESAGHPIAFTEKRVTAFDAVPAVGSVA